MKIARRDRPLNTLHQMIVELIARPGGLNNAELQVAADITAEQAASALHCSARNGRALSADHPGDKDHRRRYFKTHDQIKAWHAGPAPARVEYKRGAPKLSALGERIKSKARRPGPQIERDRAPQGHAWRPDAHTACASKMAASAPSIALLPTKIGPAPALGEGARYYVDPATVPRVFGGMIGRDVTTGLAWGAEA